MDTLHIDFETRSACDIISAGAYLYAKHPTTDILCLGFAFNDEPAKVMCPRGSNLFGGVDTDDFLRVRDHIIQGGKLEAHNAAFEYVMWNQVFSKKYDWPSITLEQLHCTMARAYAMGLPGSLENASAAVGITAQKDLIGSRIMKQISSPRQIKENGEIVWWEDEEKFQAVYQYCAQDVEVEKELSSRLMQLSTIERETWLLDQKINDRGVFIDVPNVKKAVQLVEYAKNELNLKIRELTGNVVGFCTETKRITDWIRDQGVPCEGIGKDKMEEMLSRPELPDHVRDVVKIRQLAAKSSTAKLQAMLDSVDEDGRVRGCFQYHGAATGRWAGRKIQFQNFPRPALSEDAIESFFTFAEASHSLEDLSDFSSLLGPPLQVISDALRGFIRASSGHELLVGDFAQIEARVLAWLAGEAKVIKVFQENGPIYELAASGIFGVPLERVTKEQRQIGKVAVLALGYQGGKGAFQKMAANYGLHVSEDQADSIKTAWREANPAIVRYWRSLEEAAFQAVIHKGRVFQAGASGRPIKYCVNGSFLWCQLPSSRVLCYPYPSIKNITTPWGDMKEAVAFRGVNSTTKKWEESYLYGGLQAENVTQAVARDLLRDALFRLERKEYPVISHVHDEAICEVPKGMGSVEEFNSILEEVPSWAPGLPVKAESWRGVRYKK